MLVTYFKFRELFKAEGGVWLLGRLMFFTKGNKIKGLYFFLLLLRQFLRTILVRFIDKIKITRNTEFISKSCASTINEMKRRKGL